MHGLHAVSPDMSWYSPAEQRVHMEVRGAAANVPGAHAVWPAAPVGQKLPALHSMQSAALVIVIDVFMRVPAGHGSGADAASTQ